MTPDDVYETAERRLHGGAAEWVPARDVVDVDGEGAVPGELEP